MSRYGGILVSVGLGVWLTLAAGWCADPPTPPASAAQIDAWIRQLGDTDFPVREAATRELARRPEAAAAVRRASQSGDAEMARRAADLLKGYARLGWEADLRRLRATVKDREPDLFVERVGRFGGNEAHVWQAITDFGWAVRDQTFKTFGRPKLVGNDRYARRDFASEIRSSPDRQVLPAERTAVDRGLYLFRGGRLQIGPEAQVKLLAAGGPVSMEDGGAGCFSFVNGGVTLIGGGGVGKVIVCDGPLVIEKSRRERALDIAMSLVIANGDVKCLAPTRFADCLILAAGDVYLPDGSEVVESTILAGGKIRRPAEFSTRQVTKPIKYSKLVENVADPTAPFQFFELSRVGVEVGTAAPVQGVRVDKLEDKKPFATAGIQKDDIITAVDRKKVESVAGFRKQVRTAFVQGDCTLTVRRGEEIKEIAVRFPE